MAPLDITDRLDDGSFYLKFYNGKIVYLNTKYLPGGNSGLPIIIMNELLLQSRALGYRSVCYFCSYYARAWFLSLGFSL